ncbi:MAG: hypothetical protein Q7T73_13120 [Beijerinckiaceae bacterium]|nr:hypothetical protein [Beijerinckiaceae bacterium]
MGHCVGDGSYDFGEGSEAVFSLRDQKNQPHVTVELSGLELEQAQCRGNTAPPPRFEPLIERLRAVVGARLEILEDPMAEVTDGVHLNDSATWQEIHVANGVLHRVGGPARIGAMSAEYWIDGKQTDTRFIVPSLAEEEWDDAAGLQHRDGGPARIAYSRAFPNGVPEWWQHGHRKEEDGSPWVEPRHFEKGHVYLKGDAPQIVVVSHTAKTPDDAYSLPMDGRLERNGKILREFGCTEYEFDSQTGASAFTLDTGKASYSFKNDGHGGISLSVVKNDPFYTFLMPERIPWRLDQQPELSLRPLLQQREDYLDHVRWRGRAFFSRNELTDRPTRNGRPDGNLSIQGV